MCLKFLVEFRENTDHHFCFVSSRIWNMIEDPIQIYKYYFYASDCYWRPRSRPWAWVSPPWGSCSGCSPLAGSHQCLTPSQTCTRWPSHFHHRCLTDLCWLVYCCCFLTAFEFTLVIFFLEHFSSYKLSDLIIVWLPEPGMVSLWN